MLRLWTICTCSASRRSGILLRMGGSLVSSFVIVIVFDLDDEVDVDNVEVDALDMMIG